MPPTPTTAVDTPSEESLEAVLRQFRGPLERYAAHLLGNDHARGQDIAQDTFQRLLQQPPDVQATLLHGFNAGPDAAGPNNRDTRSIAGGDTGSGGGGGGGKLKAWLFTVCRNRALDVRRKEQRMTALTPALADARHAPAPGPADTAQQHDEHAAVLRHMANLPDNQQEVLRLRFHAELTYPQIAEVTGQSVGNVGYLLHHALKTLRQQLT